MLDAVADRPHDPPVALLGLGPVECGRFGDPLDGQPWHVARYEAGQHRLALPALHRLGVATFHPLVRVSVPDRRLVRRSATVPAFPGCVFVRWPAGFDWPRVMAEPGMVRGSRGVLRPVGQPNAHPQAVPAAFMAELLARAEAGGVIRDDTPKPPGRRRRGAWARLGDLGAPERLDLLYRALGHAPPAPTGTEPA